VIMVAPNLLAPSVSALISQLLPWLDHSGFAHPEPLHSSRTGPSPGPALGDEDDASSVASSAKLSVASDLPPVPSDLLFARLHPVTVLDFGDDYAVVPVTAHACIRFYPKDPHDEDRSWYYRVDFGNGKAFYSAFLTFDERFYSEAPLLSSAGTSFDVGYPATPKVYFYRNGGGTISLPEHCIWSMLAFP